MGDNDFEVPLHFPKIDPLDTNSKFGVINYGGTKWIILDIKIITLACVEAVITTLLRISIKLRAKMPIKANISKIENNPPHIVEYYEALPHLRVVGVARRSELRTKFLHAFLRRYSILSNYDILFHQIYFVLILYSMI